MSYISSVEESDFAVAKESTIMGLRYCVKRLASGRKVSRLFNSREEAEDFLDAFVAGFNDAAFASRHDGIPTSEWVKQQD